MPHRCKRCNGSGFEPNDKEIGAELREARIDAEIGLRVMAKKVGVCPAFLSRLERGMARWTPELRRSFQSALS